jgi:hypothetical protein
MGRQIWHPLMRPSFAGGALGHKKQAGKYIPACVSDQDFYLG